MFPGSDSQRVIGMSHTPPLCTETGESPCNTPGWIRNHV